MEKRPIVLVVDDDADVRSTIAEMLEDEGFRVEQAGNGAAALEAARRSEPPAVILLDLWMPVLDGWGFLERRAAEPTLSGVPVIVMSASPFERHVPGVQRLMKKPVRFEMLLDAVTACVEGGAVPITGDADARNNRTRTNP